jgi:hypothetical protein
MLGHRGREPRSDCAPSWDEVLSHIVDGEHRERRVLGLVPANRHTGRALLPRPAVRCAVPLPMLTHNDTP